MKYGKNATMFQKDSISVLNLNYKIKADDSGNYLEDIELGNDWMICFEIKDKVNHFNHDVKLVLSKDIQNERQRGWIADWCKQELEKYREETKNLRLIGIG